MLSGLSSDPTPSLVVINGDASLDVTGIFLCSLAQVKLNGKVLTGSVGHPLPPLTGVSVSNDVALVLPAASYGFLRFDDVALPACGAPSMV
eukprot:m.1297782 g.1297782  ORF g.1297782 m.1297782 type:complete len:91 (+) comp24798_c1_seq33:2909-3181(+)